MSGSTEKVETRWCEVCKRTRTVADDSMESDFGGVNHREREVRVVTLECEHEITSLTGKTWPRPDGLAI